MGLYVHLVSGRTKSSETSGFYKETSPQNDFQIPLLPHSHNPHLPSRPPYHKLCVVIYRFGNLTLQSVNTGFIRSLRIVQLDLKSTL